MEEKTQQLEQLFIEAGKAHHEAFLEVDGADPEWPIWYAEYLQQPLADLLEAELTQSQIVYLLVWMSNEQALQAPGAKWGRYYAKFLVERYL